MLTLALLLVRGWTWLYTCRLDPAVRDERRSEVESDLWESQVDALRQHRKPVAVAAEILCRLLLGMPDDVMWRFENRQQEEVPMWRSISIAGALAVLAGALWVGWSLRMPELPTPPAMMMFVAAPPPPPPPRLPPPPPPPPPRAGRSGDRR